MRLLYNKKAFLALIFCLAQPVLSGKTPEYSVNKQNLQKHVAFLSSAPLAGRLTGSLGEKMAGEYIAQVFRSLGLKPAGDNGTYFQTFDFPAGVVPGKNNVLTLGNQQSATKRLVFNKAWRPLAFSDSAVFSSNEVIFAGYGIQAPALHGLPTYDSYQGLEVKNKWVLVLQHLPEKISDARYKQLNPYASLRRKAITARELGAKGILFVADSSTQNGLAPFSKDNLLSSAGIIAISICDSVVNEWLQIGSKKRITLNTLRKKLNDGAILPEHYVLFARLQGQVDLQQVKKRGRNVLAMLPSGIKNAPIIVVGAHSDHLGRGELNGSLARQHEYGQVHYGADDNASGVASVLEAARKLSRLHTNTSKDIVFAAWSGEEFGLLGSRYFVQKSKKSPNQAIVAAINLDMVGHLEKHLLLQGTGSSAMWPQLIDKARAGYSGSIVLQKDPYLPTDSTSFYLHKIPSINFFTGAHANYHTPRDTADTLNYTGMQQSTELLVSLILALEQETRSMDYQEVKKDLHALKSTRRVYLGTIPDYSQSDVTGVRLAGVTKGSPAERAGIKGGDVVVKLANHTIHDIYEYTYALNTLRPGIPATVTLLRGKKRIVLSVSACSL